jgi:ABC-2 type transport system ATP-binding protein
MRSHDATAPAWTPRGTPLGERVEVVVETPSDVALAQRVMTEMCGDGVQVDEESRRLTAPVSGGVDSLGAVLRQLKKSGVGVLDVGLRRPTLDDVFLTLTGHAAEEESAKSDGGDPKVARQKERVR